MTSQPLIQLKFWGVRGSFPVPGSGTLEIGGNTPCVEISTGGHKLIIDAGTGIIGLGRVLMAHARQSGQPVEATTLLSHLHHDHIQGLPFFAPMYSPAARLRTKTFPAGANIITAEQPGEVVYFILSGTVKIHIEQAGGGDVILAILGRGDTVGEMSLIDSAGRSASVLTLEETTLLWMDGASFQQALREMPDLSLNLMRMLASRVRRADEMVQTLATLDVYGRVARQLLVFADKYGDSLARDTLIPIRLTQKDIADLVGASRKRVNQVIVSFKSQGLISVDGDGRITVHDRDGLARYCR